ncbi:hypothetical protein VZT92_005288 [Zoarces viviparus]|uniref:Uncharacterized protein n=1 Tax=Zoarces viviparus TaxID=48416 RepID=A0AAW1FTM4_ZOAVI
MDKKATWDRFYTERSTNTFKHFEWFFAFDAVRDFIMPLLQTKPHPDGLLQVLDMSCGTSVLRALYLQTLSSPGPGRLCRHFPHSCATNAGTRPNQSHSTSQCFLSA